MLIRPFRGAGNPPESRVGFRLFIVVSPVVAVLFAAGCGTTTAPGNAGVPVVGAWKYIGRQSTPGDGDLNGTLTFTTQSGAQVTGGLDLIETDSRGLQRRIVGTLLGRTIDSTTVDFDVTLGAATRRHVGRVVRDSLNGTWIEQPSSGGAPTASGTFRSALSR